MKRLAISLALLALVAAGSHEPCRARAASDDPTTADGQVPRGRNPEGKPKPRFTVGKETTYVTGPRDADGRIDYVTALNERLRRGVTPASNANVLLWQALGPRPEGAPMPREFYRWLGVPEPPERGDYFVSLHIYAQNLGLVMQADLDALYDELDRASQAPWTAKQYPVLAGWLKANEKPLALVVAATRRPHYYLPLVPPEADRKGFALLGLLIPSVQRCREFAAALPARAMQRAGAGRHADAWQDLLACHRLGRLVARGGTLIENLVGYAIASIASGVSLDYLGRARLNTRQIKDCLHDLQRLPPMPSLADKVDLSERFLFLDIVMALDRDGVLAGVQFVETFPRAAPPPKVPDAAARRILEDIDWDTVLRLGNRGYDRLAAALRVADRASRQALLVQIDQEFRMRKQGQAAGGLVKALLAARSASARGKVLGDTLLGQILPAVAKVCQVADRTDQLQQNLRLAFALAAYQREHGRYPQKLEALAPGYLERIPQDLFRGKPLIYVPARGGYLLYSVGVNGQDEQGRSYDDDPAGDDLRVRMPLPPLK